MNLHVYRFRLRTRGTLRFGTFPGPALRGALGESREVYARLFARRLRSLRSAPPTHRDP